MYHKLIYVTAQFEGYHCFENAPEEVSFLRSLHRHIFHVKMHAPVQHNNRQIEFFMLKHKLESHLRDHYEKSPTMRNLSCEAIAEELLEDFPEACSVEVSEDGENGAVVYRSKDFSSTPPTGGPEAMAKAVSLSGLQPVDFSYFEASPLQSPSSPSATFQQPPGVPTPAQQSNETGGTPGALESTLGDLPAMQKRSKPFTGEEAEGPYRGRQTLFIPATLEPHVGSTLKVLGNLNPILYDSIFYGAGWNRHIDPVALHDIGNHIMRYKKKLIVEVESIETLELVLNIRKKREYGSNFLTVLYDRYHSKTDYVKILFPQDNKVLWIGVQTHSDLVYTTALDDPLFKQDQEVGI